MFLFLYYKVYVFTGMFLPICSSFGLQIAANLFSLFFFRGFFFLARNK